MSKAVVNLHGTWVSPDRAMVSAFDRSYLYGDSLYEVCRTYGGQLFELEAHLDRLEHSARLADFGARLDRETLRMELLRTNEEFVRRNPKTEAYVRLIVSRGQGRIGFSESCITSGPLWVIIAQALQPVPDDKARKGFRLWVSSRLRNDPRALSPAMKSGNYLNSLLAYLDAETRGWDDALLCSGDGFITEGTTFNVGYIKNSILVTPPLHAGGGAGSILEGITRRHLLSLASNLGLEIREVEFGPDRLAAADEVWLCSTVREVAPVTALGGWGLKREVRIGAGKPGPWTQKLRAAWTAQFGKEQWVQR